MHWYHISNVRLRVFEILKAEPGRKFTAQEVALKTIYASKIVHIHLQKLAKTRADVIHFPREKENANHANRFSFIGEATAELLPAERPVKPKLPRPLSVTADSKSGFIRMHPGLPARQVSELAAAKGMEFTPTFVRTVRALDKKREKKRQAI